MRGLASERELDRDESGAVAVAPRHAEVVADVGEERDVDVLEEAGADEVRLRADQLFGGPRPDPDRARQLLPLHDLLHRDRRGDVDRLAGVVAFAVSRRAFNHRGVVGDARLLRRLRNAVDVRAKRDHRLPRSPRRHERGRNSGDALLDREPVLLQHVDQVAVGLDLLEPELGEAEDRIDHLLREHLHRLDVLHRLGLEALRARVIFHRTGRRRRGRGRRRAGLVLGEGRGGHGQRCQRARESAERETVATFEAWTKLLMQ